MSMISLNAFEFLSGKTVLLALSGGADSVALFYLLNELQKEGKLHLACAHFEHGIRKEASRADREFVRALCEKHACPFYTESANVPEEAKRANEGLETCARRLRYDFLLRMKAVSGADVIALAHHKDDQAETVLMHLLRGGGLNGACGMRRTDGVFVRPLLHISKKELIGYLAQNGYSWREDETNLVADNPRNHLRLNVMPSILSAYPGAADALFRFSEIAQAENAYMETKVNEEASKRVSFYAGVTRISLSPAPDTAILRRLIRAQTQALSFEEIERLCSLKAPLTLPGGFTAEKCGDFLYLVPPLEIPSEAPLHGEGVYALSGICEMKAEACRAEVYKGSPYTQIVDESAVQSTCLRTRRDGDFLRPLGMGGKKKLISDVFTDKKIPHALRSRVPLLARGSEILWAAGVGISEEIKIDTQSGAIRLTMKINTENGGNTHEK